MGILLCLALPARAEEPVQILARSLEPLDTTYIGTQVTVTLPPPGRPAPRAAMRNAQMQRVFRKGNRLRVNFTNGQVAFDDGSRLLVYLPTMNIVETSGSAFEPRKMRQQLMAVRAGRMEIEQLPDDTVAGRACYVLRLNKRRQVWIDKENYLQLRQDVLRPNGSRLSTAFRSIELDAEPPAAMLAYVPPPGVPVVEGGFRRPIPADRAAQIAAAWGGLLRLRQLPPGYELRGYFQHRYSNREGLAAVYDGPAGVVTLFQGPALGKVAMRRRSGKLTVLSQQIGQADVTLIGPLPEQEMGGLMRQVEVQ